MGNPAVVTRHLTFLLQTMFDHMGPKEREEFAKQLQAVSQQCEGAPVPLVSTKIKFAIFKFYEMEVNF